MSRFSLIGQMQKRIPDTTKYIDTLEQLSAKSQLTGDNRELHKTFVKLFETYNRDAFEENSERLARLLQYIADKNEEILKSVFSAVSTSSSTSDDAKSYLTEKIKEISRQNKEEVSAMAGAIRSDIENRLGDFVREINASIESFKTKYKEQLKKEFSGAQATNVVMPAVSKVLTKDGKTVKASENFEPNIDLDEAKTFTKDTIRREIDSLYLKIKENYSNQISFIALARRSFKDRKKQEAPENAKTPPSPAAVSLPVLGVTSSSENKTEQKRQQEEQAKFESQVAEEERKKTKNLINETTRLSTTSFRRGTVGEYLKKHRVFAAIVTIPFVVFEIGKRLVTGVFKGVFKLLKGTFDLLIFKPLKFALGFALKFGKVVLGALLGGLVGITKGIKESAKFVGMISKKILAGVWTPVKNAFMMFFKTPMGAYVIGYGVGYIYGKVKKAFNMGTDWMVEFTLEKERQVKEMLTPWLKPIIDTYKGIVDTLKDIYYNQGLQDFITGVSGLVDWLLEDNNYLRIYNALASYIGNITSATTRTIRAGAGGMRFAANAGRTMVGLKMVGNASKLAKAIPYVSTAASILDIGMQAFVIGSAAMAFTQDPIITKKGGISVKGRFKELYGTDFENTSEILKRVEAQFEAGGRSLTPQEKEALQAFHAELLNEINLVEDYKAELNKLDTLYTDADDAHNLNGSRLDEKRPSFLFPRFVKGVLSTKLFGTPFTYLHPGTFADVKTYKGQINALGRVLKIRSQFLNELTDLFVKGNVDKLSTLLKDNNKEGKALVSKFNRIAAQKISTAAAITSNGSWIDAGAKDNDTNTSIKSEMQGILGSVSIDSLGGIEKDTTLKLPTSMVNLSTSATGSAKMTKDQILEAVKNNPAFREAIDFRASQSRGTLTAQELMAQELRSIEQNLDKYEGNALVDNKGKVRKYLESDPSTRGIFEASHNSTNGLTYYKINNDEGHRAQIISLYCSWVGLLLDKMLEIYGNIALKDRAQMYKGGGPEAQPYIAKVTEFIEDLGKRIGRFKTDFLAKTDDVTWATLAQYNKYGNSAPAVAREVFELKLEEARNDLKESNSDEVLKGFLDVKWDDIKAGLDTAAKTQEKVKAALEIALTAIEKKTEENSK